ncbi:MAG: threonine--tRNA ligase [Bacteroidetes bacterium]|nr:threonine--tRNA ligase [Bacteroidota bacterium]MCL2303156.1 threonine--tRNA ligase [Lentimicrobiaceae bacterium]
MIKITLPDGSVKEFEKGTTPYQIALSISEGLARNVLAAKVNHDVVALDFPLETDAHLTLLTWNDTDGKAVFWHSSAHLLAAAVEQLYPGVKFGIGPDIENGFYYDIDFMEHSISSDDFSTIEAKMLEIAQARPKFERKEISKNDAKALFAQRNNEYKVELIEDLEDGKITLYQLNDFIDLCRGPHLFDTATIKAIKLLSTAGAYWRGDEKRKQLTRIYGIAFPKKKELDDYLLMLEEAKKRDHRKLGKELELFTFSPAVGQGLPIWLPKGAELRERLEHFLKKVQKKHGYQQIVCPHIGNVELYKTSGHYQKYGVDSFRPITTPQDGEEFFLKPMNCPHHCEVYSLKPRSYRDLPLRYAEFGTVYRYEQSGELHGLTRVRGFTQDDAHIFCTPDQLKEEFIKVIDIILYIFKVLKFENYTAQISLRDPENHEKYIGSDENWDKAERAIVEAAKEKGLQTVTEIGEAAFYGPKLDFMVKDAIGRKWQLGTVQVDYNLPERFNLEYIDANQQKQRPIMIHRAPFGSMERFVAVLLEHTAGNFPLWLTPEQAIILPISDKYMDYANELKNELEEHNIRVQIDERSEKTGRKIRDAELKKIPYMLIVGEKEEAEKTISLREHKVGDIGAMTVHDFVVMVNEKIKEELA